MRSPADPCQGSLSAQHLCVAAKAKLIPEPSGSNFSIFWPGEDRLWNNKAGCCNVQPIYLAATHHCRQLTKSSEFHLSTLH